MLGDRQSREALFGTYFWTRIKLKGNQKICQGSRLILMEAIAGYMLWLSDVPKKIHEMNTVCESTS